MPDPKELIAFLRGLRAVRRFGNQPVPEEIVADLLEAARWTGSAGNSQPWEFVIVRDRETLRTLSTLSPSAGHLANAPLAILLVMAGQDRVSEAYDDGRLSERIMLAAKAHGVGSCIGWFDERSGEPAAKRLLGIPADGTARTAISLGYPEAQAAQPRPSPTRSRKPLSALVHAEHYGERPT